MDKKQRNITIKKRAGSHLVPLLLLAGVISHSSPGIAEGGAVPASMPASVSTHRPFFASQPTAILFFRGAGRHETAYSFSKHLQNRIHFLKSEKMLRHVLENPKVKATNWYKSTAKEHKKMSDALSEKLLVKRVYQSPLIAISFRESTPAENVLITNTIAETFIDKTTPPLNNTPNATLKQMCREKDQLASQVCKSHETIVAILAKGGGKPTPSIQTLQTKIKAVTASLKNAQKAFLAASKANQQLKNTTDKELARSPEVQNGPQNPNVQDRDKQIAQKIVEIRKRHHDAAEKAGEEYNRLKTQEEELDCQIKLHLSREAKLAELAKTKSKLEKRLAELEPRIHDSRISWLQKKRPVLIVQKASAHTDTPETQKSDD